MKTGLMIVPPKFIGMMTGTIYATKDRDFITLVYEDGSRETAHLPNYDPTWDYFHLVGEVQGKRNKE